MSIARERKKAAQKFLKLPPGEFIELDVKANPKAPEWMTRAFRNNRYTVMIDDNAQTTHGSAIRAMVQKHDDTPITFHWREMQKIKNEIFGDETVAVEYFPAESELQDIHNIYWMWIYPPKVLPIPIM